MTTRTYRIQVPATSANIGPGFDVCGVALSLALTLIVGIPSPDASSLDPLPKITYTGLDSGNVPLSPYNNLLTRVALYVLRSHSIPHFPAGITISAHNEIPFGRGLGSSGAAVIAGVLLGNLIGGLKLSKERLLDFALMVERHPDNISACLVGGFVGSYLKDLSDEDMSAASIPLAEVLPEYPPDAGPAWGINPPRAPFDIGHFVQFGWAKEIKAIAVMPRFELATAKARAVLPESYSRKDLVSVPQSLSPNSRRCSTIPSLAFTDDNEQVFNLQRLAVLTTALARSPPDPDLIYEAMKDRIHQPYRKTLVSRMPSPPVGLDVCD